jgi:predicted CXXCH cytochrome family protein
MKQWFILSIGAALLAASILGATAGTVQAAPPEQGGVDGESVNELCLRCHGNPDLQTHFANGDVLPLYVDSEVYDASVHGRADVQCTGCHTEITGFPHPPLAAANRRDYQLTRYKTCRGCHPQQYELTLDSMHAEALAAGNWDAAICTDCHGAHNVHDPAVPRERISFTCAQCHAAIFDQYSHSVHGSALITGNQDVPTCVDCHGVHNIHDPTTVQARLRSPRICGDCHGDAQLMEKYGISTHVFETYLADFHGSTVEIIEQVSPDQAPNEAVCYDCHGIHDIQPVDQGNVADMKERVVEMCRKCHPDATTNFPAAWLHHYEPGPDRYVGVWLVKWFYRLLIPSLVGFFAAFVLLDAGRRTWGRWRGGNDA